MVLEARDRNRNKDDARDRARRDSLTSGLSKAKRVVIICSSRKGVNARQERIAKSLAKHGYDVRIIAWDRTALQPKTEELDDFEILNFRFRIPTDLQGTPWMLAGYFFWWSFVFLNLLRNDCDVYHPENLYSIIPVVPVKLVKKKRIIYDLVDFVATSYRWPEHIARVLAWAENLCISYSEGILVVDRRKQRLRDSSIERLAEVANCPEDLTREIPSQKNEKEFVIYYGGHLEETRGLRQLCSAISGMEDVMLLVAGSGRDEEMLLQLKSQANVRFVGWVSSKQSLEMTARADLVFAFYDPRIVINRLAVSAKIPEAMMFGKPVLTNNESTLIAEIVRRERCGITVPYDNIEKIKNAIIELKENPALRSEMGANGRKAFEREFNWDVMEKRLWLIYEQVTAI
jgi:glycosyltransferase involved in cell wall biosynthesis